MEVARGTIDRLGQDRHPVFDPVRAEAGGLAEETGDAALVVLAQQGTILALNSKSRKSVTSLRAGVFTWLKSMSEKRFSRPRRRG